ncbi:Nitric oxide-responding transcriptional regulator Dnr (Crp/Fnr family) [hydrothermal vent metagenome]|uniref:Nitric oxide-responding transcriptional regulator Dnr (Crp/Fnr family) n=1 Tax=hydrothermal vent metagenome TaxID=652676 RepID=A0A1W1EHG5_9ZZZZ
MKIYKRVKVLILILLFSLVNLQASNSKNINAILDIGAQMSNMRNMLETYSLLATNVSYKSPKDRLNKSIAEYENLLDTMAKNFKEKEIVKSVKVSRKAWKPIKKALLTALTNNDKKKMMDEGLFIHANIRSVIKELSNMKKHLFKKDNIKDGNLLNASIEIQASSQRLSAHYAMKMWGLPDPTIMEHWNNGVKIYKESIKTLKASEFYKNPEFKKELDNTEKHLKYFNIVITFEDKYVPVLVHDKAQDVFKSGKKLSKIILDKIKK